MENIYGSAYMRSAKLPRKDAFLNQAAFGTRSGELLRRCGQPIVLSSEFLGLPKPIKIKSKNLATPGMNIVRFHLLLRKTAEAVQMSYQPLRLSHTPPL